MDEPASQKPQPPQQQQAENFVRWGDIFLHKNEVEKQGLAKGNRVTFSVQAGTKIKDPRETEGGEENHRKLENPWRSMNILSRYWVAWCDFVAPQGLKIAK